jgi:hypothetical protein
MHHEVCPRSAIPQLLVSQPEPIGAPPAIVFCELRWHQRTEGRACPLSCHIGFSDDGKAQLFVSVVHHCDGLPATSSTGNGLLFGKLLTKMLCHQPVRRHEAWQYTLAINKSFKFLRDLKRICCYSISGEPGQPRLYHVRNVQSRDMIYPYLLHPSPKPSSGQSTRCSASTAATPSHTAAAPSVWRWYMQPHPKRPAATLNKLKAE